MYFAIDIYNRRIHINETNDKEKYFCPICGNEVIRKLGIKNNHHFAHKNYRYCDTWHENKTEWHKKWQSLFPKDNQEVIIILQDEKHIADVLINNVIIEFQHSTMSEDNFICRNKFYLENNLKIVWVIDCLNSKITYFEDTVKNKITYTKFLNKYIELFEAHFNWTNRKKYMDKIDIDKIDLFLHYEEKLLIKVKKVYNSLTYFEGEIITINGFIDCYKNKTK